jgi:hypothetical protein
MMTVKSGDHMRPAFRLTRDVAAAVCLDVAPLSAVRISKLIACPDKPQRGSAAASVDAVGGDSAEITDDEVAGAPAAAAAAVAAVKAAPAVDLEFSISCSNGEYVADVELPGIPGACYRVALVLSDGTARRGFVKVVA